MPKDWIFTDEKTICHFRSAGILIRDGKILVQREKDGNEYALPGGHVIVGETGEASLIREYKEETGADIVCERLIWIEENFYKWGERDAHNICFYYLISLADASDIPDNGELTSQKDNYDIQLGWMPLDQLDKVTIYPQFLPEKVSDIADGIEHFVRRY